MADTTETITAVGALLGGLLAAYKTGAHRHRKRPAPDAIASLSEALEKALKRLEEADKKIQAQQEEIMDLRKTCSASDDLIEKLEKRISELEKALRARSPEKG